LNIDSDGGTNDFIMGGGTATFGNLNIGLVGGESNSTSEIIGGTASFTNTTLGSSGNTLGALTINDTTGSVSLGVVTVVRDYGTGLVIQAGTVTATSLNIEGNADHTADMTISGGSLTIGNTGSTNAFTVGEGGDGGNLTITAGSLTYLGTDGLLLNIAAVPAAVTLTGGTTSLTGITLDDANTATTTSTLAVKTGATLYLGGVGLKEGSFNASASITLATATIGALANWTSSAPIALTSGDTTTFQTQNASGTSFTITLSGTISATGGILRNTGTGTLVLSGSNTYTGGTTISSGTVEFDTTTSMPATGAVAVSNGATLAVMVGSGTGQFTNSTSTTTNGSIGALLAGLGGQSGSTVSWSSGSALGLDTTNAAGGFAYVGNITTAGLGLTKLGTGTLTLSGTNSYTGPTTVTSGALTITGNLTGTSSVSVASGATLDLTASTVSTTGAITNNGTLVLGNGVTLSSTGTFTNNGTLDLTADPSYTLPGNFVNHGTVLAAPNQAQPADTPTMSQWELAAMAALLLLTAGGCLWRRPVARW
jgi:autotransporter-associated beta strand protein